MLSRPQPNEYQDYHQPYLDLVHETDLLEGLDNQISEFRRAFSRISADQVDKTHAPYTWTLKQVLGHIIDNERVFGYRASRIAVGDQTELPGYDQEMFVNNADYSNVRLEAMVDELEFVRRANLALLKRLPEAAYGNMGTCDGKQISVRAIACLLIGHLRHHQVIVEKRIAPRVAQNS